MIQAKRIPPLVGTMLLLLLFGAGTLLLAPSSQGFTGTPGFHCIPELLHFPVPALRNATVFLPPYHAAFGWVSVPAVMAVMSLTDQLVNR